MRPAFPAFYSLDSHLLPAALLTGGLLAGSQALAQVVASVSEKDFLSDMPIVLSVSRLPQRLDETPGAVTILDHDMIRRSGARDVADLLRLVPGFQVSNSFEAVAPLVSYHGSFDSFSNRLELLIDGRSAYSPYFIGSIGPGLQTVALEDIERIEVLRGSNSAAYGARAVLGVINIVTRDTADTLGVQAATAVGENGIRDVQMRVGWGDLGATYRLTADSHADDGLTGANGKNHEQRVNFRTDIRPNGVDEIQVRLGALQVDAGRGLPNEPGNPQRVYSFDSNYAQLDWRRNLGEDADLAFKLSHSQESYHDQFPFLLQTLPAPWGPLFGPSDIYTVRADGQASSDVVSLQYTQRLNPAVRTVWGGEFRSERVQSPGLYNTDAAFVTNFTRLFGNLEWRIAPQWLFNAGALAEHSSVTGDTVSPRLMANWHLATGQTLRAGVSRAFRPPSTFEKFADIRYVWGPYTLLTPIRSSGQVQAETLVAKEIGYLGEFPEVGLDLDVRVFDEHISGFVRQTNSGLPKDYVNDEDFPIRGVEYQLKWKPWQGGQFVLNQAYTDIGSTNLGSALAAPQLATTISYSQALPGQMNLSVTHVDNSATVHFGSASDDSRSMTRTDMRLAKSLYWGARRGEIALVLQNMGQAYMDYKRIFLFERRAFITLRMDY